MSDCGSTAPEESPEMAAAGVRFSGLRLHIFAQHHS